MAAAAIPGQLAGKVAAITGGTQGLGEAIARLFAARGAAGLAICGRNVENGERVASEISGTGCPTEFVICSVETRAKSDTKLLTIRSICIFVIVGMLSLSSRTPGSISGTAWPAWRASAFRSSSSISRTNVACSSSRRRSSAPTIDDSFLRSSFTSSSTLTRFSRSFICP